MTSIVQFSKVIHSLCSCGSELGKIQREFEFGLSKDATSEDVAKRLNEMGLWNICCRRSFLCAPVYIVASFDYGAHTDTTKLPNEGGILYPPMIEPKTYPSLP